MKRNGMRYTRNQRWEINPDTLFRLRVLAWEVVERGLQFDPEVNPRDIVWGGILSSDDWAVVDVFYSSLQTYESPTLALSTVLGHNSVLADAWMHPGDYQPRKYL